MPIFDQPVGAYRGSRKIALVIGNNAYRDNMRLRCAVADAEKISEALAAVGFDQEHVHVIKDVDQITMVRETKRFLGSISEGDVVFVYYAGHAAQVNDRSYLLPVDFSESDVESGFELDEFLQQINRRFRSVTNVVVLDCCRDHGLDTPWVRFDGTTITATSDRHFTDRGFILSCACEQGTASVEPHDGPNGWYTQALAENLHVENNNTLFQTFEKTRDRLVELSGNTQRSWEHRTFTEDIFLTISLIHPEVRS
jgi:uncharacterized caspase-like protein